jgi:plastocyanin
MVKPGDTVRYLNEVGGGTVTRVEGKIAYHENIVQKLPGMPKRKDRV